MLKVSNASFNWRAEARVICLQIRFKMVPVPVVVELEGEVLELESCCS